MKVAFEHVDIAGGCSVRVYHRKLHRIPLELHHHPEYELTLTLNSQGMRFIGDDIGAYGDSDLVLVPPDLPHSWSSAHAIDESRPQEAVVVWFDGGWARQLARCCPEYKPLLHLMRRAGCGLAFAASAAALARERVPALLSVQPRLRLMAVLDLLCLLAEADARPLASPSAFDLHEPGRPSGHQPERINRILVTIDARFAERLTPDVLAAAGCVSVRSLNRYFRRHLGESVSQYLARVRIGHACRLLVNTVLPVSVIAGRAGYPKIAHFNRQFRSLKGMAPLAYRRAFSGILPADTLLPLAQRPYSLEKRERTVMR